MPWKDPSERHHDDLIDAIRAASHHISTAITEGFKHMADQQSAALADLSTAVANLSDAIAGEIGALQAALSAAGQPDDSGAIETAVTNLNNLTQSLKASVAPPAPTATPAPTTTAASVTTPAP